MSHRDDQTMMQTAAALANLAVLVYDKLLVLPSAVADPGFARAKSFLARAKAQNVDEARRFNAAAQQLGGKAQDKPDPVLEPATMRSLEYVADLAGALAVASLVEMASAASCAAFCSTLADTNALRSAATIAPVQASRVAVLTVLRGLAPDVTIAVGTPPQLAQIPGAVAVQASPVPFFSTTAKRSPTEGSVA
jgi:hypothetical protein